MKKCEQALLLICSHALDIVGGQRSVRIASPSLPPHHGSPAIGGDSSDRPWQGTGAVGEKGPSHPDDTLRERFNRYGEPKVPGCWTAVMKRQGKKSNPY